jgi:hypothetical protein
MIRAIRPFAGTLNKYYIVMMLKHRVFQYFHRIRNGIPCALFSVVLFAACKKSENGTGESLPKAAISDVKQDRSVNSSVFHFTILLDKPAPAPVTIHYATLAGSAVANTDFIPADGNVTIAANQQQAFADVTVKGDSLRKADQVFYVQLDHPQNCEIQDNKATGTIVNKNLLYFPVDNTGYVTPSTYPGYVLAWQDEFDGAVINESDWTFESGNNNGWGNNELEYYTDRRENSFVSNGNLIIEARAEQAGNLSYTSARMITKNKKIFKFGRIDIRAKMPVGKGIWPALWMLGNNISQVGWPACGEIDILEMLGHEPNKVYGTLHWGSSVATHASKGSSYVLNAGSFDQQFHVYSLVWKQDEINVLVDDQPLAKLTATDVLGSPYPFNNNFFFIFNIAVGGNWPGAPDNSTVFPQRMIVDYVRVFQ